jgi:hypothetical protein
MSEEGKKTQCAKTWMDTPLFLELSKLAANDDRSLSEYINTVLRRHVYGHGARPDPNIERPE